MIKDITSNETIVGTIDDRNIYRKMILMDETVTNNQAFTLCNEQVVGIVNVCGSAFLEEEAINSIPINYNDGTHRFLSYFHKVNNKLYLLTDNVGTQFFHCLVYVDYLKI